MQGSFFSLIIFDYFFIPLSLLAWFVRLFFFFFLKKRLYKGGSHHRRKGGGDMGKQPGWRWLSLRGDPVPLPCLVLVGRGTQHSVGLTPVLPVPRFSPCPATGEVLPMVLEGPGPQGPILLCPHPAAGGVPVPAEPALPIVPQALTHRSRGRLTARGQAHLLRARGDVSANAGAGPSGAPQLTGCFLFPSCGSGDRPPRPSLPSAPAALRLSPGLRLDGVSRARGCSPKK